MNTSRYLLTIAAAAALAVTVKADPILSSSYPVLTLSDGGSGPNDTATITAAVLKKWLTGPPNTSQATATMAASRLAGRA